MSKRWHSRMASLCLFVDGKTDWSAVHARLGAGLSDLLVVSLEEQLIGANPPLGERVRQRSIYSYGPSELDIRRKTMRWLRHCASQPVASRVSIKQLLIYRGISLWWFLDPWWLLLGSKYFPFLHEMMRQLEQIREIIAQENPKQVVSACSDPHFHQVLTLACAHVGIPLCIQGPTVSRGSHLQKQARMVLSLVRFAARALLHKTLTVAKRHRSKNSAAERVVVFSGDHWGRLLDKDTGEAVEGESYFYEVFKSLKQNYSIRFLIELVSNELWIKNLDGKLLDPKVFYKPFEAYAGFRVLSQTLQAYLAIRRRWKQMERSASIRESFAYDNDPCWDLLVPRFRVFFSVALWEALLIINTAFAVLEAEGPKAVVVDSRMGKAGRGLIHAARCMGVPSVAVEHSFFLPDNPWDFLTPADTAGSCKEVATCCPLPDAILVYGGRDKELMVQGSFPADIIEITGAPRWDALPSLQYALSKEALCATYGLETNRPIVLLTTQNYYPAAEEDEIFRATCHAVKQIPGAQLVVKLHPLDTTLKPTTARYMRIAGELGFTDFVVRDGYILYELLRIADVLVSLACNTAIEASLMGKPVVLVDLFDRGFHDYFLRHSALLEARSSAEILRCLRQVLFDPQFQARLRTLREDFVSKYCYRADGHAWQRVVLAINQQISKSASSAIAQASAAVRVCPSTGD